MSTDDTRPVPLSSRLWLVSWRAARRAYTAWAVLCAAVGGYALASWLIAGRVVM